MNDKKIIVVISSAFLSFLSEDFIADISKVSDLIGIFTNETIKLFNLPENLSKYFKAIYYVSPDPAKIGIAPVLDEQQTSNIIRNLVKENDNIELVNLSEEHVEMTFKLAYELLGKLKRVNHLLQFKNKPLMKQMLADSEIMTPKYEVMDTNFYQDKSLRKEYYDSISSYLGSPFIAKPSSLASSKGFKEIHTFSDFEGLTVEYDYEFEEKIKGQLYHVDIALLNDKAIFRECCSYTNQVSDFMKGKMIGSTPVPESDLKNRMFETANLALFHLKAVDGVYHMELFHSIDDKIIFLEVAARPPGSWIIPMYHKMYGINLAELDFILKAKITSDLEIKNKTHCYAAWAIFPRKNGIVKSIGLENQLNCEYKIHYFVKENDSLKNSDSCSEMLAIILIWSEIQSEVVRELKILEQIYPAEFYS